jgi:hypothetical protein
MPPACLPVALRQRVVADVALLAFPALWLVCLGLAQIHLLEIQQPWSRLVWLVVLVVPVAFVLGGLMGREVARRPGPRAAYRGDVDGATRRRIRPALLGCAVVGNLEEVHQFVVARTIPLFSSHIDVARFALPGGPTIILTDLLTVAAVVALVLPRRLFARKAIPEVAIAVFALSGFAFAAGRGAIIQAITVAAVARWIYRGRPSTRVVVVGAAVLLVFSVAIFYVRTSQHTQDSLGVELRRKVYPTLPSVVRPLVPVDLALATNMEALARIVAYFPANEHYGHGAYDVHGFDLFIPEAKDIQTVSAQLSPPWVTSTVAGPFWADGGLPLVVAGVALIGALVSGTWTCALRTRDLRVVLVAANLFFLALFGVYVNLFTEQVDWILITPLLWVFGAAAERLNVLPHAIRTRLVSRRIPTRDAAP